MLFSPQPRVALLAKQKRNAFQRKIGNAPPTNHAKSATAILAHGTVDHLIVKVNSACLIKDTAISVYLSLDIQTALNEFWHTKNYLDVIDFI